MAWAGFPATIALIFGALSSGLGLLTRIFVDEHAAGRRRGIGVAGKRARLNRCAQATYPWGRAIASSRH